MVKSAVRVFVRTRPTSQFAQEAISLDQERKSVSMFIKRKAEGGFVNNQQESWNFQYDGLLHNASQERVYDDAGRDCVDNLFAGYNGTIMAYGQTGAGKTFTMVGGTDNYKYRGLIPRTIAAVFHEIQNRPECAFTVRISYLEIYNEVMYDLLSSLPTAEQSDALLIVEDSRGTTVKGLTGMIANSEEEALNLFFEGETNRAIGQHSLNKGSTRSHCIFTINLENRSRVESNEKIVTSKLHLVDLAGSERLKKTQSEGVVMKEAMYINRSLTFLEQVVIALADKRREHVPFRQCKLTNVLKDSLGGNCKTTLVANIWGEASHLEETISTLKFASRMTRVHNEAIVNVQYDPVLLVKKYEKEIKDLKQELAMHDTLANRSHVAYEPYTEEQRHDLRQTVQQYIAGEVPDIDVVNLRHIREIFMQFRVLVRNAQAIAEEKVKSSMAAQAMQSPGRVPNGSRGTLDQAQAGAARGGEEDEPVGDVEGPGFGIATKKRLSGAEILTLPDIKQRGGIVSRGEAGNQTDRSAGGGPRPAGAPATGRASRPASPPTAKPAEPARNAPDRTTAFEIFKKEIGSPLNRDLLENKATLKDKKRELKDISARVNDAKATIDRVKDQLDRKKAERDQTRQPGDADEDIIDEEEFALLKQLKDSKNNYREAFDSLRVVKSELDYVSRLVDQCRQKLILEFERWYDTEYGAAPQAAAMAATATLPSNTAADDEDMMDYGEQFDKLEMNRIIEEDPESFAFYNARKHNKQLHKVKKVHPPSHRTAK